MVEPENVELFADEILYLLKDREKARRMGDDLRERACAEFSMEASSRQLLSVYEKDI